MAHSKPTHPLVYHCPQDVINLLVIMAEYYGKSRTAIITDGLKMKWEQYCKEIDQTLPVETGADNATLR